MFKRVFIISSGVILAVTGIAKLWSGFGDAKILAIEEPITGIAFAHLLIAVGLVELAIAALCFSRWDRFAAISIALLATNFIVYRGVRAWSGYRQPCSCLGSLTGAIHIPAQTADNIMKIVLVFLTLGSYAIVLGEWLNRRRSVASGGLESTAHGMPVPPTNR